MRSVFISASGALGVRGSTNGGVQICTNEYLAVLGHAGFDLLMVSFEVDRRLSNRIDKRFRRRPYHNVLPPDLDQKVFAAIAGANALVVFLNFVDLAALARPIRQQFGSGVKIVLLSHGLHSADLLHEVRLHHSKDKQIKAGKAELARLAGLLTCECEQRQYIDHVFCLSDFEVGIERWIGAQSVSWLPRIVESQPLSWRPVQGRLGFIGTLDHPPNSEGLELFLKSLSARPSGGNRVRVVGGPEHAGKELACRYPSVDYLGLLTDEQVANEAATWACAIHPLFCYPRGCSTKLATLLSWQIPIAATPQGCRGYRWKEGGIPQAKEPAGLVELALSMDQPETATAAREDLAAVVATSPSLEEVAQGVNADLSNIGL